MSKLLNDINSPADLRRLPVEDLPILAQDIRDVIIKTVSRTGGHLAPSLGASLHLRHTSRSDHMGCGPSGVCP